MLKDIRYYALVLKYFIQGDSWENAKDFAYNIVYWDNDLGENDDPHYR